MAIAFVQQADNRAAAATTVDVTLTGVGAGNLIVMNCMRSGGTDRTLTTSDVTNGDTCNVAIAEVVAAAGSSEVAVDYVSSATGGNTTYRLTAGGSTIIEMDVFEFSGHDSASPLDTTSTGDNASGTSHVCAAAGAIDTAANVIVTTCIQFLNTSGGGTQPSGYTMSTLAGTTNRSGYKGPGTYTNEDAAQTTVTARSSIGCVASWKQAAAGGGAGPLIKGSLLTGLINGGRLVV